MKTLQVLSALIGLLLSLTLFASPAMAGGWAVVTLDAWPEPIVAGQTHQIGFTVRQHGNDDTKLDGLTASVTFSHPEDGKTLVVDAVSDGREGHYTATFMLPAGGKWAWSIQVFGMNQPLPALTALDAGMATNTTSPTKNGGWLLAAAGGLGILIGAGAASRKRYRWAVMIAALGLALGLFGLASAAGRPAQPAAINAPGRTPAEMGAILFVTKGCVSCHANNRIEPDLVTFSTEIGPDLSNYVASAEFLALWLKDPKTAKPQTLMPNLQLSPQEIADISAFLAAK